MKNNKQQMQRQLLTAIVQAQSQQGISIWVSLKAEPDTDLSASSRNPGKEDKRRTKIRKVRQERRKANKGA